MATATLQVDTQVKLTDKGGNTRKYGWTKQFSSQKEIQEFQLNIAASGTAVVWDPVNWTSFPVSAFKAIVLKSDADLDLEFTINEGDTNEELVSVRLVANTPLILGADDAYYNHSASDAFGGSLDVIDKIRANNPDAENAVELLVLMVDDS